MDETTSSHQNSADVLPLLEAPEVDVLTGIRLDVSLRFGQGQIPLRQILELGPESVVELDQRVEDPVELLVGGRVIARGEVVSTDNKYGLRISEIVDPQHSNGL